MGSGCIALLFLDLGTSWRWVVSFTPRQLYPRGKRPSTYWIGGWVGPRADLDDVEKIKFLILPGQELQPLGRPAPSQSLYRLRYPGSSVSVLRVSKWNFSHPLVSIKIHGTHLQWRLNIIFSNNALPWIINMKRNRDFFIQRNKRLVHCIKKVQ
jgi:hypothetical protein